MKPVFTLVLSTLLIISLHQGLTAQTTYHVTTSTTQSAKGIPSYCSVCTITVDAGATLTMNTNNSTCYGCTFNGGGTIAINLKYTCQGCTFTDVTVNENITAAGGKFTLQSAGSPYDKNTITNSTFTVTAGQLYANSPTSFTNSTVTLNNASTLKADNGQFLLSGSNLTLNGDANFTATSGPIAIKNNSELLIGDGNSSSTAFFYFNGSSGANGLNIYDNSLIAIASSNNYYRANSTYRYNTTTTVNPGSFTYGCATMNSSVLTCVALASTDLHLTATLSGTDAVLLNWQDDGNSNTAHFVIEHSLDGSRWTALDTIQATAYVTGGYHFTDAAPAIGNNEYRVILVDKQGHTIYSPISSITVTPSAAQVGLFPNPVTGNTFYITTHSTTETLVSVFTVTGQSLLHASLKGQTQYPVSLPASVRPNTTVIVQVISQGKTQAFPVLIR